ncbi:hypothetical protein B0H14DRAFT_2870810 [Mycena olivaceomarginata]|nr:hypothetical protein B0H14DRAFT_2870810 [Mycena olivaceomarginata]
MGFCRRCGNIVTGERCRCGGMAVAPVVPWNQTNPKEKTQDRWSKTYVSADRSPSPTRTSPPAPAPPPSSGSSPTKRFPRPLSQSSAPQLGNRVSAHITSTTTSQLNRPPSPLKYSSLAAPESGILPSPHDTTLSKVYGSVLQPRESLPVQSCAHCATPFAPTESTIYPDPYGSTAVGPPRFFCRSCFIANGGSRGACAACFAPCSNSQDRGYWHKKCFDCAGCDKNIGDSPMVDLLGRPCCPDCFDTCLERDATPKKPRNSMSSPRLDKSLGGNTSNSKSRSREGSPALEELEQRLGIVKTRQASPALEELSQRLSMIGKDSPTRSPAAVSASRYSTSRETSPLVVRSRTKSDPDPYSSPSRRYERFKSPDLEERSRTNSPSVRYGSGSPSPVRHSASPGPTEEAIEEMKRRFMKSSSGSPATSVTSTPPLSKPRLRSSRSSGRLSSPTIPPTPDLTSDFSDTTSSAGPDSPPRDNGSGSDVDVFGASKVYAPGYGSRYTRDFLGSLDDVIVEETKSQMGTPTHTPKSTLKEKSTPTKSPIPFNTSQSKSPRELSIVPPKPTATNCVKCHRSLFSVEEGGRYVTVPDDVTGEPRTYHTDCFTCVACDLPFKEAAAGQALFVKGVGGPSHVECAPPQKITVRTTPTSTSVTSIFSTKAATPGLFPRPPSTGPVPAAISESSKYDRPPLTAPASSTPSSFPRFGGSNQCPGCRISVSPMERGVVPGPHGSRWHASCLICGGRKPPSAKPWLIREERKKGVPGCGKKLDSAAKEDGEGGVWCRECSLLLPSGMRGSPQGSPTRAATLVPSYTGQKVAPQFTGTTTIARQFTGYGADSGIFRQMTGGGASPTRSVSPTKGMMGYGGADPAVFRQLTGGSLSPTRSISPTKGLTSALRPRPKSVVGIRNTNIVRQMTGGM